LIKAFGEVAQHNDNISLIIAGDGPRRSGLKRLVGDLGLRDKIKLLAWSDRGQIVKYLKGCEFFVLPSRYEAFGMTVIESLSAGKPVIAAACGGPEEIIKNGINGILVEKENSRALAGAIRELLTNRKLFTDLIEGARNSIGGFGIEKTGQEYLTIFRRCE
jgi:glycosyltransferase involved in cell wall biosynthesis